MSGWFDPKDSRPKIQQWAHFYLPNYFTCPPAPMHERWFGFIEQYDRVALAGPRKFAKSVIGHFVPALYYSLEHPGFWFMSVSNTPDLAVLWLHRIKTELYTNPKILEDYPWLLSKKSKRATTDKPGWEVQQRGWLEIPNGSTIMARGIYTAKRGGHPDMLVVDDLEDDEMAESVVQRKKCETYFFKTLLGMKPKKLLMIGNYVFEACLLQRIIENNFGEERRDVSAWKREAFQAVPEGTATSAWEQNPELCYSALLVIRDEMGEDDFAVEFQNKPGVKANKKFLREWVNYFTGNEKVHPGLTQIKITPDDPLLTREDCVIFFVYDAAASMSAKADYRAWALFAFFQAPKTEWEKQLFILDWDINREHPRKVAREITRRLDIFRWRIPVVTRSEEGISSLWLEDEIRREAQDKYSRMPKFEPISIPGNKMARWNDSCAFFAGTPLCVPKEKHYGLVEQCVHFPHVQHDDAVDVVQIGATYAEQRIGRRKAANIVRADDDEILFPVGEPEVQDFGVYL